MDVYTEAEIREFTEAYQECAEWATADNESMDYPCDHSDEIKADCLDFMQNNVDDLNLYMSELGRDIGFAGHDFYLTRNGHGSGFWDRSYKPEHTEFLARLTDNSHRYGETLY